MGRLPDARAVKWSYGVMTCPFRRDTLLPQTLASLKAAGFDSPRLFVDGAKSGWESFGLQVTYRDPPLRTFGNWWLGMWELYVRSPWDDLYAMFQDDLLTVKNLRQYLERSDLDDRSYYNLYTFPENEGLCPTDGTPPGPVTRRRGFYRSNQLGRGALALVFRRSVLLRLFGHERIIFRPMDAQMGWRRLDGAIVESMKAQGIEERVHNPSLVTHVGASSSMGNLPHVTCKSFPGVDFDALDFLIPSSV